MRRLADPSDPLAPTAVVLAVALALAVVAAPMLIAAAPAAAAAAMDFCPVVFPS